MDGSESQGSDEPVPLGIDAGKMEMESNTSTNSPSTSIQPAVSIQPSARGVENARRMLRAFALQKKPLAAPAVVTNIKLGVGALPNTAVVIGKLPVVKPAVVKIDKPPNVYVEKMEKPPKPGELRKAALENSDEQQRKTLLEIEHLKRKQEMVDLGIPLGLLCPEHSKKAVPTKAMPPIKTFLDNEKVDEIIAEAKKAKAEGKEFKFDYSKFVPDYENPFQRKTLYNKEDSLDDSDIRKRQPFVYTKEKRSSGYSRYERNKEERNREDRHRDRNKYERAKSRDSNSSRDNSRDEKLRDKKNIETDLKSIDKDKKHTESDKAKIISKDDAKTAEAKVNLNDYLVCDSWSLDNEDKSINSPQVDKKATQEKPNSPSEAKNTPTKSLASPMDQVRANLAKYSPSEAKNTPTKSLVSPMDQVRANLAKFGPSDVKNTPTPTKSQMSPVDKLKVSNKSDLSPMELLRANLAKKNEDSPKGFVMKFEKLNPVIDSFKFEIDDDDDEDLDIFDEKTNIQKFAKPTIKKELEEENEFLESVINEIGETDKGLVAYESPKETTTQGSVTPDMDDSYSVISVKSDNSDGWRSMESRKSLDSFKSTDTGYKSSETVKNKDTEKSNQIQNQETKSKDLEKSKISEKSRIKDKDRRERSLTAEKELDIALANEMSRSTVASLETWSFVLKICQPILFRHDRNKCYKETRAMPKLWYTENPKVCNCVQDRAIVYEELEMCKPKLIDRVYESHRLIDYPLQTSRSWYPIEDCSLIETAPASQPDVSVSNEWEASDKDSVHVRTPVKEVSLDNEYEKFMQAVLPEVADVSTECKRPSRSTTPQKQARKKKMAEDITEHKKGGKKMKLSSNQDWSLESEPEDAADKSIEKSKKRKKKKLDSSKNKDKMKVRKRKLSSSTLNSVSSDDETRKRKKIEKKTTAKKVKQDKAKRRRLEKKMLKQLDAKKKKKLKDVAKEESVLEESFEKETKKKDKKLIKKKVLKMKKKADKKKKRSRSSSSSDSTSSDDSSDDKKKRKKKNNDSRKKKKTRKKKKKRRHSTSSDSQSEELFDVNILNNIKTERVEPTPAPAPGVRAPREIINVNTLQDDFTTLKVKQEKEEEERREQQKAEQLTEVQIQPQLINKTTETTESQPQIEETVHQEDKGKKIEKIEKIVEEHEIAKDVQEDFGEDMDIETTSKSKQYKSISPINSAGREQDSGPPEGDNNASQSYGFTDYGKQGEFEDNYEMYEQMAMEYQSDVAKQISLPGNSDAPVQQIETVVQLHSRGEIKCDWRATDEREPVPVSSARPSRWGLKPSEVNIVLTGDDPTHVEPVYRIQSIANSRTESTGYDEAYEDMYGASDRLQYGDCFESSNTSPVNSRPSLDSRINTVLAEAEAEAEDEYNKSNKTGRVVKRVTFADGYKPGQDSDVEEPPEKKRKRLRRTGCAWPCPTEHPDHVALWDALPPPPPPPGSPPPPLAMGPPLHLLRQQYPFNSMGPMPGTMQPPMQQGKDQPHPMLSFMPPEPPPGLISFT